MESRIQRVLNGIAEYNREHQGTVAGGTVFVAGAGAEIALRADAIAIPAMFVGAIIGGVSAFADYANNILAKYLPREIENIQIQPPPGFHDEETTIMSAEELQRAAEEGRLAHEALALTDRTEETLPSS